MGEFSHKLANQRKERNMNNLPTIEVQELDENLNVVTVTVTPHYFLDENDALCIDGEHGDNLIDYYGEYRGGYPYIDPALEALATKLGGYWEWRNSGSIVFCEA
tara:strand:- start:721 stop:1032 length:312 start_codon:yes stop_codon:yes gene_type:complete